MKSRRKTKPNAENKILTSEDFYKAAPGTDRTLRDGDENYGTGRKKDKKLSDVGKQPVTESSEYLPGRDGAVAAERERNYAEGKRKSVLKRIFSNFFSSPFKTSVIISAVGRLVDAIYDALSGGFIGRIFTSYKKEEKAFEDGFIKNYYTGGQKTKGYVRKGREKLSEAFEKSYILGKLSDFMRALLATSVKLYGNCLLSFGIYTVLVYYIKEFVPGLGQADISFLITGICVAAVSLPLMTSKKSLAEAVGESKMARLLFISIFGFREESFEVPPKRSRARSNAAVIAGILCGLLTFFVHPLYIPVSIGFAVSGMLIMVNPEIGIIFTLFALPFFSLLKSPSMTLAVFVLITAGGYLIKLVRGKRILKIELIDFVILIFGILIWLSGVISSGGRESLESALISCFLLLGYFLVVNTMRTEKWLIRCVTALVSSATIVSLYGIYQYFAGKLNVQWLDTSYFTDIRGRVVSLFENSNVLAFYLVMVFPLSIALISKVRTKKEKFLCLLASLSMLLCIVFTWSRGAWVALIAGMVLFFIIYSRRTLKYLLFGCFAIPFLPLVLPSNVVHRFMSIGDLSDSSTFYRVYTWRGTLRMIKEYFWSGIGYGTSAFTGIYPEFAYAGMEAAEHSHSLFLQILCGIGFPGLLVFIAVMFLFSQRNLEYFGNPAGKSSKIMTIAAFTSVISALIMGLFDYIWYSYRIFFLFWVIVAISNAYIRIGDRDMSRRHTDEVCDRSSASLDLQI